MIAADDARHGTSAGYCAGCREECCRSAIAAYSKRLRTRQYLAGGPMVIDALGTKRRIRALMALGWTSRQIDAALDREPTYSGNLLCGPDRVNRATAALVADVYDRMSMMLPENAAGARNQSIARSRNLARRNGWPPPLAWDDIDDPDEQPTGWEYAPAGRDEILTDLLERGAGISEACRVLHTSRDALQKWCGNNDLSHVYRALAAREVSAPNQYTDERLEVA